MSILGKIFGRGHAGGNAVPTKYAQTPATVSEAPFENCPVAKGVTGKVMTCWSMAQRFVGLREIRGAVDNPSIMTMLTLNVTWPDHDEVPWCSAFANYVAHLMGAQRSRSLMARSWLEVGEKVTLEKARPECNDVAILWRGSRESSSGHVAFFGGVKDGRVILLGGNQSDAVNVQSYPLGQLLGIRRIL